MEWKSKLFCLSGAVVVKDEKRVLVPFVQKLLRGIKQFVLIHLVLAIRVSFNISDTALW